MSGIGSNCGGNPGIVKSSSFKRSPIRVALAVVIPVVCVLSGYFVGSQLSGAGDLPSSPDHVDWLLLGSPVAKPVNILAADVNSVATISANGTISYWQLKTGWQEVGQLPTFRHSEDSAGLDHEPPPGDVIAIRKLLVRDESGIFIEYAILEDGSVWIWKYQQPGLGLLVAFVYGLAGSCIGLFVGLVLAWWVWRKIPQVSQK
jgi:hypothetical protein